MRKRKQRAVEEDTKSLTNKLINNNSNHIQNNRKRRLASANNTQS